MQPAKDPLDFVRPRESEKPRTGAAIAYARGCKKAVMRAKSRSDMSEASAGSSKDLSSAALDATYQQCKYR